MVSEPHMDEDRVLRTVRVLRSATQSLEHSHLLRIRHTFIDIVDTDEIGSARRSQSCSGPVMPRERTLSFDKPPPQAMTSPNTPTHAAHACQEVMTSPNTPTHAAHAAQEPKPDVDSASTNLYVGFLTPDWTEELLTSEFGHFGTVTSVKIMYPRTERQRLRGMNCGFVQFTTREEAERAKAHVDGKEYFGTCIRIGWGTAVRPKTPGESVELTSGGKDVRKAGAKTGGNRAPRCDGADRFSDDNLSSQSTGPPSSSSSGSGSPAVVHRTPLLRMGSRYKRRIRLLKMRGERQQQQLQAIN